MKCTNCNAELIEGAKFCGKCGTPAPKPEPEEVKCSKCGAKLVPNAKFCGKCGTPVSQAAATTPVAPEVAKTKPAAPKSTQPVASPAPVVATAPVQAPMQNNDKKKKKNGNGGLVAAIIIMCLLLIAVIGIGVYFIVINPDALSSWFGNDDEIETMVDEDDEEEDVEEKDEEAEAEEVEEADDEETEVEEEAEPEALKDYEKPEYMNGPTSLGRSDRVSVVDFVAPVPDDSIQQPADGSIPVQYFDPSIHEYDLFIEDVTFYEASQRCEEMDGHLATIVCKEELLLVQDLLKKSGYDQREVPYIIWLGAYIDQSTGMYAWCTDEGIGVSNWMPGEPTGTDPETGEKEEYIMMMYDVATDQWVWVDESYDISEQYAGNIAYLCEWEVITDPNYYEDLKTR